MTSNQLAARMKAAILEGIAVPYDEQWRRLVASGIINEKGEVQMGPRPENDAPRQPPEPPPTGKAAP